MYNFEFFLYTVWIQYQPEVLPKILEAVVVMSGPLFLNGLLLIFVFIAWLWQKLVCSRTRNGGGRRDAGLRSSGSGGGQCMWEARS